MDGARARELEEPEPDEGDSGAGGEGGPEEAQGVVAQVDGETAPGPQAFLNPHATSFAGSLPKKEGAEKRRMAQARVHLHHGGGVRRQVRMDLMSGGGRQWSARSS